MGDTMRFETRDAFREWLSENCRSHDGVWLLFGKAGGPKTLKAGEALEEALCFGWIDGQMKKLDETSYIKYFSERRADSKWSEKNKKLTEALEGRGLMTDFGREKIAIAKEHGRWDAPDLMKLTEEQTDEVAALLEGHEPAYRNFRAMPPSVQKTYARAYFDAKTQAGREKRLLWLIDRLDKNLRPMEKEK